MKYHKHVLPAAAASHATAPQPNPKSARCRPPPALVHALVQQCARSEQQAAGSPVFVPAIASCAARCARASRAIGTRRVLGGRTKLAGTGGVRAGMSPGRHTLGSSPPRQRACSAKPVITLRTAGPHTRPPRPRRTPRRGRVRTPILRHSRAHGRRRRAAARGAPAARRARRAAAQRVGQQRRRGVVQGALGRRRGIHPAAQQHRHQGGKPAARRAAAGAPRAGARALAAPPHRRRRGAGVARGAAGRRARLARRRGQPLCAVCARAAAQPFAPGVLP